jgi:hypothetical protein
MVKKGVKGICNRIVIVQMLWLQKLSAKSSSISCLEKQRPSFGKS